MREVIAVEIVDMADIMGDGVKRRIHIDRSVNLLRDGSKYTLKQSEGGKSDGVSNFGRNNLNEKP